MKPRDYARRKAQQEQREGVPYHVARKRVGRQVRAKNEDPRLKEKRDNVVGWIALVGAYVSSWACYVLLEWMDWKL